MIALRAGVAVAILALLIGEVRSEEAQEPKAAEAPAAVAEVVTAALPSPAPPAVTLTAVIDLSSQRMSVAINGKAAHSWAISSGRAGYATPTGTFRPQWKARMWHSRKYDMAPMPHSVFFKDGVAVHATSAIGMLGRPASHGCIRLAPGNAATFYNLVARHGMASTRITVRGVAPTGQIAQRGQRTRQARLPRGSSHYAATFVGRPGYRVAVYQVYAVRPLPQRHAVGSWR
jgi:hypothetical protein